MRHLLVVTLITMLSALAAAQQQRPTFRSSTRLVVQIVSVTNERGYPVEGLTADDFAVTEDGIPQSIAFVEFQRIDPASDTIPAISRPLAVDSDAYWSVTQTNVLRPPNGGYRDRRLLVLYFDMSAMPLADQMRAYTNARKFVAMRMKPLDLVAVMAFQAGAVRVHLNFTDDRPRLMDALDRLFYGEDQDRDGIADTGQYGTPFGQADAEFGIFNTDRQLSALQTAVTMLRSVPEQKALVFFASGLRLNGTDNHAQLRATANAAIRSNVVVFPIDARGLEAQPPLGDATKASPGGLGMFSGETGQARITAGQRSQDSLYALAKDTGGRAMFDDNDLSLGIAKAADSITSYYIVGYYTTNTTADGRFRRLHVTLARTRSATLSYRRGYFGDKTFADSSRSDKERQLEEALMLENPLTEIPLALEVNYFQLNQAEYFVPVFVKLPGSELALARGRGAARTQIDVIGEIKDDYGATVQNVRDRLDVKLSGEVADRLSMHPVQYETGFTLLPGKYVIKLLVRDGTTGRIGTYQSAFTIPNLNREERRIPISSVVLGSQRVALGDALHSVHRSDAMEKANPLVHEGQKLVPSVTRVFSRSRDLHVFLQAYMREATGLQTLFAYVGLYRGDTKALETAPMLVIADSGRNWTPASLRFSLPLESVSPGRYECQVTVLTAVGQKAAFWRAPVVVVP